MSKIGVIGDSDSVVGFKSLGIDVYPATGGEIMKTINRLASGGYSIIFITEQAAEQAGDACKVFQFPYHGAGKSIAIEKPEGLVKVICDAKTDEILGAHIIGHNATELIHEILLAKSSELLPEDIATMVHAHPTLSEATMEAMRGIYSQPIHG